MKDRLKILLASADTTSSEVLTTALEESDRFFICGSVRSGSEAVKELRKYPPDVLLLDLLLPELDDIAALRELENGYMPPILATSAFMSPMMVAEAQRLGVDALMTKPYSPEAVVQRLIRMSDESTPPQHTASLEASITALLREIGVPAHIKGYQYIREAVMFTVEDPSSIHAVTKVLYPHVAQVFDTTPSRVERAIRHAVEVTWTRSDPDTLHKFFSRSVYYANGKPSNSEFIAAISDCLLLYRREGMIL